MSEILKEDVMILSGLDISLKTLSQWNEKQKHYKMVFEIAVLGRMEFTKNQRVSQDG